MICVSQGRQTDSWSIIYVSPIDHVVRWEPCDLHDLFISRFLGWICAAQILHTISQRQIEDLEDLDDLDDLDDLGRDVSGV